MKQQTDRSPHGVWFIALTMAILTILAGLSGYFIYDRYQAAYRTEMEHQLEAIASLKVGQIEEWRKERASDATGMYLNNIVRSSVERRLKGDKSPELEHELVTLFNYFGHKPGYGNHYLLRPDGSIDLSSDPSAKTLSPVVTNYLMHGKAKINPELVHFIDFHRKNLNGPIVFDVLTPVTGILDGRRTLLGYILLEVDPEQNLFPLIQKWPTPSRSAESLLVRREGNEVVYLDELRYKNGTTLNLRLPVTSADLPGAMAVQGTTGMVEGKDYQGKEVVALLKKVPDSPWYMIVKIDKEEIYAPTRNAARIIFLIASLTILSFGGAAASFLMKWRANHYRYLTTLESQRAALFTRLENLMQNASDAIIIFGEDLVIKEANARAVKMYGCSREELIGMSVRKLRTPETRNGLDHDVSLVNRQGRLIYETSHMQKNGTGFPVEISTNSMEIEGVRYYQSIIRDITERKAAEAELLEYYNHLEKLVKDRTIELEEKNRKLGEEIAERKRAEEEKKKVEEQLVQTQKIEALGRFAGGIAHDLNNILYPVIINTEALLDEAEAGTESYEMLKQTLEASYRQRDLVKQILSFSRQGIQKLSPIKITPLLEKTLDFIRSTLPSTIELQRSINAQSDTIMGDPTQIQQVIMNLCNNAADALASQRGIIEVSLSDVHLDSIPAYPEAEPGRFLEFKVRDTGSGMSGEVMDHIFDPFYTTKGVGKGSGMGLSVVHGILKNHGGAITVESKPGKGSLFTVYLPVYDEGTQAQASAAKSEPAEKGKETILLIDDEDIILSSLQRVLQKAGYRVVAVKDPLEALELFSKTPDEFDLVITDLTMPKMTGLELGKKLIEIRSAVPIMLSTGFSDIISEEEIKADGFKWLLKKPAGAEELKEAVRKALDEA